MKTALLLVNVGTPDKPEVKAVRRYLTQFLNDRRVIDLPWLLQKFLVNVIIVPFRAPKSSKLYKMLWGVNGSPLLYYTNKVKDKLQKLLPNNYTVFAAMRYGNPSLKNALEQIKAAGYEKLIVIPQFPQYASSSTGTVNAFIMNTIKKWNNIPSIELINQFYDHPGFIKAFAKRARDNNYQDFDHIVFSYHGLPIRQINKNHPEFDCKNCSCINEMPEHGKMCYKATCYETTRLLAQQLNLKNEDYTVAFQSRLSKNWLEPFSDQLIIEKANQGVKRMLFLAPAFVADCLETEVEIGIEYAQLFKQHGGKELIMAKSLNDMDEWIEVLFNLIKK
jgi:ferrochelatase